MEDNIIQFWEIKNFWEQTLNASTFWEMISAISTFLALLVALFLPYIKDKRNDNIIIKLIKDEFNENGIKINALKEFGQNIKFESGPISGINTTVSNLAIIKHIDVRLWNEYKFHLSRNSPSIFEKYYKINSLLNDIIILNEKINDQNTFEISIKVNDLKVIYNKFKNI